MSWDYALRREAYQLSRRVLVLGKWHGEGKTAIVLSPLSYGLGQMREGS